MGDNAHGAGLSVTTRGIRLTGAAARGVDHQRVQGPLQGPAVPEAALVLLQEGVGGGHLLVPGERRLRQACRGDHTGTRFTSQGKSSGGSLDVFKVNV